MSNEILTGVLALFSGFLVLVTSRFSVLKTSDALNPVAIVGLFFVFMYVGKFLYLGGGSELIFSYNYKEPFEFEYLVLGLGTCLLGYMLFAFGFLVKAKRIASSKSGFLPRLGLGSAIHTSILTFSFLISLATLGVLYGTMGVDEALAALNNRFDLFAGRGYLFLGLSLYKVSLFLWLASLVDRPSRKMLFVLVIPAVFFDLATGSRGKVLFENILPLIYLLHRKGLVKLDAKKLILIVVVAFLGALIFRSLVRDTVYEFNQNKSGVEIILENFSELGGDFYAGPEAPYLDTAVLLIQKEQQFLLGSTLAAVVTYPIPRAIFEDKPRGASAVLTERYFPAYFYPYNIEISFPFVSEVYANFWFFGLIFLFFAGYVCALGYNAIDRAPPWVSLICVFLVIRFVLLFRNDFFNNATSMILLATIAFSVHLVNSGIEKRSARRRSSNVSARIR